FCIVSSDSDFTRLALRLREAGMVVLGMGQKKTPNPFIVACDKFIYLEILAPKKKVVQRREPGRDRREPRVEEDEALKKVDSQTVDMIASTVSDLADDSGWAFLGEVGNLLLKKQPDFD